MMKKHLLLLGALIFLLSACGGGQSADISADASGSQPQTAADVSASAPEVTKPDASLTTNSSQTASSSQGADGLGEASQPEDAAVQPTPDLAARPGRPVRGRSEPPAPAQTPPVEKKPGGTAEPGVSPEPDSRPEPPKASKETASAYIGRSVSSLISAIGEPKGRDYAPSCLGDGEDGELFYDGFTVYTYRSSEGEIVQDII